MLIDLLGVIPLLRCPQDGSALKLNAGNETVSEAGRHYHSIRGKPVLVDFANSVFDPAQFEAKAGDLVVQRAQVTWGVRAYRAIVALDRRVTVENTRRFLESCRRLSSRPRILIVGGGTVGHGTEALYESADVEVVAFDVYDSPYVQFVADAHAMPLRDGTFDGVFIQAVLEHVLEPHRVVGEIFRVLKMGGVVYAETPFMQQVHEGPYDFTRFSESGHRWLFHRFDRIDSGATSGPGAQLIWSMAYVSRGLFRSTGAARLTRLAFFWLHYLDWLIPTRFRVDGACGVFFLGTKGTGITCKEIIRHYRGGG